MARQKKYNEKMIADSLRFPESLFNKMKYIVWFRKGEETKTDFILNSLEKSIKEFEAEHGEITTKKLEQGRII